MLLKMMSWQGIIYCYLVIGAYVTLQQTSMQFTLLGYLPYAQSSHFYIVVEHFIKLFEAVRSESVTYIFLKIRGSFLEILQLLSCAFKQLFSFSQS